MAYVHIWSVVFWLNVFLVPISHESLNESRNYKQEEDRLLVGSIRPVQNPQAFLRKASVVNNFPKFLASLGGLGNLHSESLRNLTTLEKVKKIGDAIMPIIMWGLAMCGQDKNMIGGVVAGLWDVTSPAFGPDPMTRMINEIKDELFALKMEIQKLAEKLTEKMRKELDGKLKFIFRKWFEGETNRNKFVCDKYAWTSKRFSDAIRNNRPINESLRLEMIMHLHDCDDFLKDTAGVFQFRQYADILWVPSIITTLMRVSYLTEATNYGTYLKIENELLVTMWKDLKADLKKLFELAGDAVYLRLHSLMGAEPRNFTPLEYEGCRIQANLLYFDREFYPHGVPKFLEINNYDTEINIADYNVTEQNPRSHIQIYYEDTKDVGPDYRFRHILNCMTGQRMISRVPTKQLSFRVTFVTNKSYHVRVLYFCGLILYDGRQSVGRRDGAKVKQMKYRSVGRVFATVQDINNTIEVILNATRTNNPLRTEFKSGLHFMDCSLFKRGQNSSSTSWKNNEKCVSEKMALAGVYVIENVYAFNVLPTMNPKGEIIVFIENRNVFNIFLLGVELIVRPLYNVTE